MKFTAQQYEDIALKFALKEYDIRTQILKGEITDKEKLRDAIFNICCLGDAIGECKIMSLIAEGAEDPEMCWYGIIDQDLNIDFDKVFSTLDTIPPREDDPAFTEEHDSE
jgi:hypothetical protein